MKKARSVLTPVKSGAPVPRLLLADVRHLILSARASFARTVNAGLVALYWEVGRRIRRDILRERRAEYGEQILQTLSAKLTAEFGRGYSARNLGSMVRFSGVFPRANILQTLSAKLGWSHFQRLIYVDDPLKREVVASDTLQKPRTALATKRREKSQKQSKERRFVFCALLCLFVAKHREEFTSRSAPRLSTRLSPAA